MKMRDVLGIFYFFINRKDKKKVYGESVLTVRQCRVEADEDEIKTLIEFDKYSQDILYVTNYWVIFFLSLLVDRKILFFNGHLVEIGNKEQPSPAL